MAISEFPIGGVAAESAIDIEAWTVEQAAHALSAASLSSPAPARGSRVTIEIPLDAEAPVTEEQKAAPVRREPVHTVYRRREPIRRDSLNRRDAVLKGKEGSRRRQRWENDRLLSNPHAQPPLPSDWEVRPTYPVQNVPYFLAPLWDAEYKARSAAKAAEARRKTTEAQGSKEDQAAERAVRDLRAKLKRSRGAKGLLQDLEEEVRSFIAQWEDKRRELENDGLIDADSEDEEIVFVGRNGAMSDETKRIREEQGLQRDKLIFQGLVDDHGAAFGRWLVHSIATYYGLETWSVTTGNPARREAYIGLKQAASPAPRVQLPRPLWGLV